MLTPTELERLEAACRAVPPARNAYVATDLVTALVETVVDYQQHTTAVERAMRHFTSQRHAEFRSLVDLQDLLARFPDDEAGNRGLALHLWGYQLWTRAAQLRGLVQYVTSRAIVDLDGFRAWAAASRFADFQGQVPGTRRPPRPHRRPRRVT